MEKILNWFNFFKKIKFYLKIFIWIFTIFLVICYKPQKVWKYDKILEYGIIQEKYDEKSSDNDTVQTSTSKQDSEDNTQSKLEELKKKVEEIKKQKEEDEKQTEKIDDSIKNMVTDTFQQTHNASSDLSLDDDFLTRMCKYNQQICNITSFDWDFDTNQKIKYQALIIYLIKNLNTFFGGKHKITDTLYKIRLVKWISDRRGYAGHSTITIDAWLINSNKEFFEVLTHEMWHHIDLWILKGSSNTKSTIYTEFGEEAFALDDPSLIFYKFSRLSEITRSGASSYKDFVTWYGMSDPFEDFAECFNLYINHHSLFVQMKTSSAVLANKYNYIRTYLGDWYIFDGSDLSYKVQQNPYRRPWDSTKIK